MRRAAAAAAAARGGVAGAVGPQLSGGGRRGGVSGLGWAFWGEEGTGGRGDGTPPSVLWCAGRAGHMGPGR
jgi:hypothetical protein